MTRVAMMGSGSWGTAFAMVLAHAGCEVTMWARDPKTVEQITTIHQNRTYHPGIELPAEDLEDAELNEDLVGYLHKSLYGTRDAATNWQE